MGHMLDQSGNAAFPHATVGNASLPGSAKPLVQQLHPFLILPIPIHFDLIPSGRRLASRAEGRAETCAATEVLPSFQLAAF
jgi:hypothetical protein